jgi:very-short-patch-repair endonuclease
MPHQPVPPKNRSFARAMRREMTEAEEKFWSELRNRRLDRIKFQRQMPIGNYIADFVCLHSRLIVDLDGSQPSESRCDAVCDAELKWRGFRVLRFWNDEVLRELISVCDSRQPWR